MNYSVSKKWLLLFVAMFPSLAFGQLAVTVLPAKVTGQKAIVPLVMKNNFGEKIESARAALFLMDDSGKLVGQSSKWVIGGGTNISSLASGGTNSFYFVIQSSRPFTATNLTSKVTFSRVVLEGGKMIDVKQGVEIHEHQ